MLRLLGQSEYGLYQLVYSVVSYLGLLSFGFSSSYMRFYARLKVKSDDKEIARLNGMFLTIFICIAFLCIFCGIIMVSQIEVIFGNGLTALEYSKARILMLLMIFNLALTFPNSVFDSLTSAHEQFAFQKSLVVLQNLLNPFIILPLLIMGYGSVAMIVVATGLTVAKLVTNIVFCLRNLGVHFLFNGFKLGLFKEMWIFTFFIFINLIVDQINWSVDKFLLGRFSGTVAVAIYGVGAQLNTMYLQLSTAVSSVFIPKVNQIVAETGDNNSLTKLFAKVGRIQFIILTLVLSGFIFFGQAFIRMWAGDGYDDSYRIALFLMFPVTIPLIQNLGIEIQRAKNMHKTRSMVYLLIAISNIIISIPCIKQWGAQGAAVGTAFGLLLGNGIFMNWYYHKRIGINTIFFWKQIARFIPALIVPVISGICIMLFISFQNIITLLIVAFIYGCIYFVSMWCLGLDKEEKQIVYLPIIKLWHKIHIH